MSERVAEFLIMLSKDPVKLDAFLDDPRPLLQGSGLTGEERELLLSGDPERIRAYIGENSAFTAGASTTSQTSFRPHPPPPPPNPPKNTPNTPNAPNNPPQTPVKVPEAPA